MATRFNLNLGKTYDIYQKKAEKAVNDGLDILKDNVDSKTPEDTKKLLQGNDIIKAKKYGSSIVGVLKNDTKYAEIVEFGVGKSFNYHKPKGSVFYKGSGARMYTRGFDESEDELKKLLKNKIKQG